MLFRILVTVAVVAIALSQEFDAGSSKKIRDEELEQSSELEAGSFVGISKTTVIDRMQHWVEKKVPYSQTHNFEGYRQDCSGYVSMGWNSSKPGHTTSTMTQICTKISKSEMQAGDVLLKPGHHVLMFHKWLDNSKESFMEYAEHDYGQVASHDKTTYQYHRDEGYFPCRYNKIN